MVKSFFGRLCNRRSILFLIAVAVLCVIVSVGFCYNPLPLRFYMPQDDDLLETHEVDSTTITHSILADDEGNLELNGEDCYFEIHDIETSGKTVALYLKEPLPTVGTSFSVTLDYGDGTGFHEDPAQEEVIYKVADKLSTVVCFDTKGQTYSAVRIRPDRSLSVDRVEIHENDPVIASVPAPGKEKDILKGVLLGLFLTMLFALAEAKFQIANAICEAVRKNKRYFIEDVIVLVVSIGISVLLNKAISGGAYTFAFNAFVVTAIFSVFILIRNVLLQKMSVEGTFFALILATGICMTLCCWPNETWDSYFHYLESVQSTGVEQDLKMTDADFYFGYLNDGTLPSDKYTEIINYFNEKGTMVSGWVMRQVKIHRLPAALFMTTVNLFGGDFYARYIAGRLGQLLIFAICGYLGMKRLRSGKMLFGLLLVMPLNMFQATNYSYDYWATAFLMLGMAYFVGILQDKEEPLHTKDAIMMFGAFVLGCMPRLIYAPILIFPFLLPAAKTKNKKLKHYIVCVAMLLLVAGLFYLASKNEFAKGGDFRGDDANPTEQLALILADPIWYAKILIRHFKDFLNPVTMRTFTFFAYLGHGGGDLLLTISLIVAAITDKDECDKKAVTPLIWIYSILFFFGEAAAISTSMYLAYTRVGWESIAGAQPRYMMPIIYSLFTMLFARGVNIKKYIPEKYYNAAFLGIMFVTNFVGIYNAMLPMTLY